MKAEKLSLMSIMLGLALIIFIIEAQIPPVVPVPGIKLGLANIITLMSLYILGRGETFLILILRIILSSIFTGNMTGFLYSAAGGIVCFLFMSVTALFVKENKMWITSEFGALGHNIGQIVAAVVVTGTPQVIWYLPVLIISAVITGLFTGISAQTALKCLKKTNIDNIFRGQDK